ncbi:GNAT family N-acetyltransferase [Larsenimonas suaedae]|uniref:GNAT family N-acetyltransferase n=1 Tax=Larsenimonas suaedae TaxID=1851019 RepID=A0ABU1GXJ0_9GAMM|nr:GNAT family N-acetyltransferase [Larsenimonas suaedae]MCM2971508.1 GNAT family N-acetyltransferase [Larsenimonas suaedae]MDR5896764.1 GNAT family N-acetyltransferase [Larsenimonas suaedae]
MTGQLRAATPHDVDALWALEQACFSPGADRFNRRQISYLVRHAKAVTGVFEQDGHLTGYATLLVRARERLGRIYSLCVHPSARGAGLGEDLVDFLEDRALELGLERLVLEVRVDNDAALTLYARLGFERTAWLDDYYSDGCAAWKMSKPLTPLTPLGPERS